MRQVDLEQDDRQKLSTAVYPLDSTAVSNPGGSVLTANQQTQIVCAQHRQAEIHAENGW